MDTAVQSRMRHYGLSEQEARSTQYATALGRSGLTDDQRQAGEMYGLAMGRYYTLTGVPFPSARAQAIFTEARGTGLDESESKIDAARRASEAMKEMRSVLLDVGDIDTGRRVERIVKSVCLMDIDPLPGEVPFLARGLNALARYWKI